VQDKILEICARRLSPNGIAYVSYNTYPGWHARGAIREMLWYHTERFADPADRVREARGLLAFLVKSVPAEQDTAGFGALVRRELALLQMTPDTYLLHEHLEEFNEPLYFHQFAGRAAGKGLQYLAEAQISAMVPGRFGAEVEQTLRTISPDLLHMEQYMDFLRNRMFRQTLLCRGDRRPDYALRAEAVEQFYVSSAAKAVPAGPVDLESTEPVQFRGGAGDATLTTRDPLMKAAMVHLGERWPLGATFADLLAAARKTIGQANAATAEQARQLAMRLLNCYVTGVVEFSLVPPSYVGQVSARPVASAYARLRAKADLRVTNLRLETVALSPPSRLILDHLDGRHDRAALLEVLRLWLSSATIPPPPAEATAALPPTAAIPASDPTGAKASEYLDQLLQAFARSALLIA
jgi:methyltransferase-like protein